ncbi:MAG: hypothetical protein SVR94_12920 [Pseudomonadota bacterium]|nr:hypothetical protein [Pseudomonadota bacterium]
MLLAYLEPIDLEWGDKPLTQKALRIDDKKDGNPGIRRQLGLDSYNCCDYCYPYKNKICFIECSDLGQQLKNLEEKWRDISAECQKELKEKKINIKSLKKEIRDEIRLKLFSSLLILFRIPTQFKIKHSKIHDKIFELFLVIPIENDIRVLDYLETDLKCALAPLILRFVKN